MTTIFTKYNQLIKRNPLITNMLTTGFLFGSGDALAQALYRDDDARFDYYRTLRAGFYGTFIFGPMGDKWYKFLSSREFIPKIATKHLSGTSLGVARTVGRVAVDQLVFAPFIGIPLYFSVMAVITPGSEPIAQRLKDHWWPTLSSNWKVWPLFQMVNFYIVPVQFRLLAGNIFAIGWNCHLSSISHRKKVQEE